MSADGRTEQKAVLERMSDLAGGRVFESILDNETHARTLSGDVKVYIVVLSSFPTPVPGQKTLTDTDSTRPHVMTTTIAVFGRDFGIAADVHAEATKSIRDWRPSATSEPFSGVGGFDSSNADARKKPTRFSISSHWTTYVNMGPDAA